MTTPGQPAATIELTTPVQFLPGCGPQRVPLFARLGVTTVRDLLFLFPRDYQDLTDVRPISALEEGRLVSVLGVVEDVELRHGGGIGRSVLGVLIKQDASYLRAMWFNVPFMQAKFKIGQQVLLSGKARLKGMRWEMLHPQVAFVDEESTPASGQILPVYPLTEGLVQGRSASADAHGGSTWRPVSWKRSFRRSFYSSMTCYRCRPRCRRCIFPPIGSAGTRPGGDSFTRSCSFCRWRWRSSGIGCGARRRLCRWRRQPKSTRGSAGCFPLPSPTGKTRPLPRSPATWRSGCR